ncbi:TonB-dependent receptor, partial [Parapusillimonas sp. SGNA-6]|nr:TonB-dependent receptor [Parapusillimonas sp. SGNA-6]
MDLKFLLSCVGMGLGMTFVHAQTNLKGRVVDLEHKPISAITVSTGNKSVTTDQSGTFEIYVDRPGRFKVSFSAVGYPKKQLVIDPAGSETVLGEVILSKQEYNIDEVEVFGERGKQPKGLEDITRMPLKPSDQIQSISIISHKVIEDQGALTLTDAVRNIPGVTLFGSYGGVKESMSTRGFRS